MECYTKVRCPKCGGTEIMKSGLNHLEVQRYRCQNTECFIKTFMLEYSYRAYVPGVKDQAVEMAINGSGIRDTARVLNINKNTVINLLKKKENILVQVNPNLSNLSAENNIEFIIENAFEAEMDEQWSYVGNKSNQRWLWYAIDHATNKVLAYVFGKRKDVVFQELKDLLAPFNITRYYTDDLGTYTRHLDENIHEIGKANTQKIERKNLNFRTWIKRLARKTICFSKLEKMHDTVIGLLINKVEFGLNIHV
jgi:IS1 family transposase/transposase-like protein